MASLANESRSVFMSGPSMEWHHCTELAEHHIILDCPGYVYAKEQFQDLFHSQIPSVNQLLYPASVLEVPHKGCCMNIAESDGSVPGPKQTLNLSINRTTAMVLLAKLFHPSSGSPV